MIRFVTPVVVLLKFSCDPLYRLITGTSHAIADENELKLTPLNFDIKTPVGTPPRVCLFFFSSHGLSYCFQVTENNHNLRVRKLAG